MRLLELNLAAFGPFTDCKLEFPQEPGRVHFVYGANEAGKSSALRGIKQALYGIPTRTADDFIHKMTQLRIGLRLRNVMGDELSCVRRKGLRQTLLEADGQTPLDDGVLQPFLGGLTLKEFEQMFGIDHPTLVKGGEEIVQLQGTVDKSLFSAAGGVADLQRIQDQLEADAAAYFAPRLGQAKINAAIGNLEKAKVRIQQEKVPSKEWAELSDKLEAATRRQTSVREEVNRLRREHTRLERFLHAYPLTVQRRELLQQLAALGDVRLLPDDFSERRNRATLAWNLATKNEERLRARVEELTNRIDALTVPQELLDQRTPLEELPERLGIYRKAQQDLPGLIAQRDQLLHDARSLLAVLRPNLPWEQLNSLKISRAEEIALQNLGNRFTGLSNASEQAASAVRRNVLESETVRAEAAALPPSRDGQELRNALHRLAATGTLESKVTDLRLKWQQVREHANASARRLDYWSGTAEELERLVVPSVESTEVCEEDLKETASRLQQRKAEALRVEVEAADCRRELEALKRAEGHIPTEEDLERSRLLRDSGWRLVLQAWQVGKPESEQISAFLKDVEFEGDLAPAYERSVQRADETSDRLRREADRVARWATLEAELLTHEARLRQSTGEIAAAEITAADAGERWQTLWKPAKIIPASPKEMRAWLKRVQEILEQCRQVRNDQLSLAEIESQIQRAREELSGCLAQLGEVPVGDGESLSALRQRATAVLQTIDEVERKRAETATALRRLEIQIRSDNERAAHAQAELTAWQAEWSAAVTPLGLPGDALPAQALDTLGRIRDLFERVDRAESFARRIREIGQEAATFEAHVDRLLRTVGAEGGRSPEESANLMISRGRRAEADHAILTKYQTERDESIPQWNAAAANIDTCRASLEALCAEAGCRELEQLPTLEQRSASAKSLAAELRNVEKGLAPLTGGVSLDDFAVELSTKDVDALPTELQGCANRLQELNRELENVSREQGALDQHFKLMNDGTEAADAAQALQDLVARIGNDCAEYARLRLAAVVLKRTIERFREKNQGPILQRAGKHFSALTGGRFSGLQVEYNEQDAAVIVGVRSKDRTCLHVEAMSDGTADQLYLALRMASLETYLQHREPVPFIVDDILIQFDDDRAAATLSALANLSNTTQVILFTHHEHLLEVGRKCLGADKMFVQRLSGPI